MKKIFYFLMVLNLGLIALTWIYIPDKELANKLALFLSITLAFLISYITGFNKGKKGLIIGIIVGLTICTISLVLHFFFAKDIFMYLPLRLVTIFLSALSGGVMGVNNKKWK